MYLRLAFAVAAYLEPEILIVDEVLAVGDANFQRKCLDKMQDVGQQGRTVLLVSHNMSAITRMCSRAILINEGKVIKDGPSTEVVGVYLSSGLASTSTREWPDPTNAPGGKVARLRAVRVRNEDGQITDTVDIRRPVNIEVEYEVLEPGRVLLSFVQFHTQDGVMAFESNDLDPKWRRPSPPVRPVGDHCLHSRKSLIGRYPICDAWAYYSRPCQQTIFRTRSGSFPGRGQYGRRLRSR